MKLPGYRDYPREVVVNGEIWTISFVNKLEYGGADLYGLCDPSEYSIKIVRGLGRKILFRTFRHELMHAIEFSYDIDEMVFRKNFDPHDWIYAMEEGIAETEFDNWQALRKLFK